MEEAPRPPPRAGIGRRQLTGRPGEPWPVAPAFLLGLLLLSLVVAGLVQVGVLVYAYQRIGVSPAWLLGLLAISLLGSAVNLPLARLPAEIVHTARVVTVFGVSYLIPETAWAGRRW